VGERGSGASGPRGVPRDYEALSRRDWPVPDRVFNTPNVGKRLDMTIGTSIFLIAVGAILRYATNFHVRGVDIDEVGLILMIVGAAAFVISLLYELIWAGERSRWYRYGGRDRYVPPGPDDPRYQ
jgi:hypothetical protein